MPRVCASACLLAVSGVSNLLDGLLGAALRGEHGPVLDRIEHMHHVALDLGIDGSCIDELILPLRRLADGAALIGRPLRDEGCYDGDGRVVVDSTRPEYLRQQGLGAQWVDARDHMRSLPAPVMHRDFHPCPDEALPELARTFSQYELVITQGFIARASRKTVLLGRGGSDTSALLRPCFKLSAVKSGRMFLVCTRRILAKSLKIVTGLFTKRRRSHRPALLYCIHGAWDRSGGIRYLCMSAAPSVRVDRNDHRTVLPIRRRLKSFPLGGG